jgi:hypothetical protein
LDNIDLSHVKTVDFVPPKVDFGHLLQRCRSLRKINVGSLVTESFDWAVQEKRRMESLGEGSFTRNPAQQCIQSVSPMSLQPLQPTYLTHGPVQLAEVAIKECAMPARYLDAIVFAFNQSLKRITIGYFRDSDSVQMIHLGRGWTGLSVLHCLELHAPGHRLALESLLFSQCPSLTNVKITDNTFEYSRQDIIPWLPAKVSKLKCLFLKGWSALTFNPAMLESAKELTYLKMSMARREGLCFVPAADDLDRPHGSNENVLDTRPQWTWDWQLPCLVELNLNSEFAYRFEFRMLQGCKSIETLRLHMRTADGNPTRMISNADLITQNGVGLDAHMCFPSIRRLYCT